MTEKFLPFTDEVIAVLVHKCSQQLQILALHLEMLGYIQLVLGLLKRFGYLRKTGYLIVDNLICRLLRRILVLVFVLRHFFPSRGGLIFLLLCIKIHFCNTLLSLFFSVDLNDLDNLIRNHQISNKCTDCVFACCS